MLMSVRSLLLFRRGVVILPHLQLPCICPTTCSPGWGNQSLDKCAWTDLRHPKSKAVLPGEKLHVSYLGT